MKTKIIIFLLLAAQFGTAQNKLSFKIEVTKYANQIMKSFSKSDFENGLSTQVREVIVPQNIQDKTKYILNVNDGKKTEVKLISTCK
jgi:hypothetical protein